MPLENLISSKVITKNLSNTSNLMNVLIPFNCIYDADVGLIKLIRKSYTDPKYFDPIFLEKYNNNFDLVKLLYLRKEKNPIKLFIRDQYKSTTLADEFYKEFFEKEYLNILENCVFTGIHNFIQNFNITDDVKISCVYSNDIEFDMISSDPYLPTNISFYNISEIKEHLSFFKQFFFKSISKDDIYSKIIIPEMSSNTAYELDYRYNLNDNLKVIENEYTELLNLKRCNLNIINAYDISELGISEEDIK